MYYDEEATPAEEATSDEESVYDEEGREELVDGGEISPEEAAFMKGYEEADDEKDELDDDEEDGEEE